MSASHDLHLFLLPGLLSDARLWQHQMAGLSDIAHVSVADLSGADTIAALAAAALSQAPAKRFALGGLSMGGYVALEMMRQAPERIQALALLDTNARPDTPEATENRRRLMQLAARDFSAVTDTLLPKLLHPDHVADASLAKLVAAMARGIGVQAFLRQQRAIMARGDSRPSLSQISCPTLVLCGREDSLTPVEVHEEMAQAIPRARLVVIEQCGHLSALEQPQQVNHALRRWLTEIGH
ncbi:alpha/beta fold hydrolase [Chitinimonas sp.]|uniref:alpha/beta fold hydrolase n=1 Tax=Chitinimonas sp. TaxID=1934313 RepID=UPI002F93CAF6